MRNIQGNVPKSALSRFLLGAGIGVAISVPLFVGIEELGVRILLMAVFAGTIGGAQVLAGGRTERSGRLMRWMLGIGTVALVLSIAVFMMVR